MGPALVRCSLAALLLLAPHTARAGARPAGVALGPPGPAADVGPATTSPAEALTPLATLGSPQGSAYEVETRLGEDADGDGTSTLYRLGDGPGDNLVTFDGVAESLQPYCCSLATSPTATESYLAGSGGSATLTITVTAPGRDLWPAGLINGDGETLDRGGMVLGAFSGNPLDWTPPHRVTAATIELFAGATSVSGGPDALDVGIFFGAPSPWNGRFAVAYSNATGLGIDRVVLTLGVFEEPVASPGMLAFTTATTSVSESAATATLTVARSDGSDGAVSVHYATAGGTASAGSDYQATSGTLAWADGDTVGKAITIPVNDDFTDEADETVGITLDAPSGGATLGALATATLTIRDDDTSSPGSCTPGPTRLCLNGGRFAVETRYATPAGASGDGQGVQLTPDTGYFWFFRAANVEMVVKVLDACAVNDRFWVFAGGLTNVAVEMVVTDTATGAQRTYHNPLASPFQPIQDTAAFAGCGDGASRQPAARTTEDPPILVLGDGRFALDVSWRRPNGVSGIGRAVQLTADTGYFWFFNAANVEMVVKVLDACTQGSPSYWVFAGGLTNVEVTLRVVDVEAGSVRVYTNPQGAQFQPLQDTAAFPTCDGNPPEPELIDDAGPDLPPPTIQVEPLLPGGGKATTVTVNAPAASAVTLATNGDGCGALPPASNGASPLVVQGVVAPFGSCTLTASIVEAGSTRISHSAFTVEPNTVELPAVEAPDGYFVPGPLPTPSGGAAAPSIAAIDGPGTLINGGSVRLRVRPTNPADLGAVRAVLVEVPSADGFRGHYELAPEIEDGVLIVELGLPADFTPSTAAALPAASRRRYASQWSRLAAGFPVSIQLADDEGRIGAPQSRNFTTQEVAPGSVTVALSWDTPTDVDLHVVTPLGHEIYYGTPSADGGSLDLDSNAGCSIDGINNEHVTWPSAAPPGEYVVRVDFWSDCAGDGPPRGANWTVNTTVCGEQHSFSGSFSPGSDDHGGAGSGVEVTRFDANCTCGAEAGSAPASTASCSPYRVRGTARFEKRRLGVRGFQPTVDTPPIRLAQVQVRRLSDNALLGEGRTKADGSYDVLFGNSGPHGYRVEVLTISLPAEGRQQLSQSVTNRNLEVYSVASDPVDESVTPDKTGLDLLARASASGPAFNIFDAGVKGAVLYRRIDGVLPAGSPNWVWEAGQDPPECGGAGACFKPDDNTFFIADLPDGPNGYFDSTLLHEFGHLWTAQRSGAAGGGSHSFSTRADPFVAWSEGLANFWGQWALRSPHFAPFYRNFGSTKLLRIVDLEAIGDVLGQIPVGTSDGTPRGGVSEFTVSRVLWDLADPAVDAASGAPERVAGASRFFDTVANPRGVFTAAERLHPACVANALDCLNTFQEFLDAWCAAKLDSIGNATSGAQGLVSGINEFPYTFAGPCQ